MSFLKGRLGRHKKSAPKQPSKDSGTQSFISDDPEKSEGILGATLKEDSVSPAQEIGSQLVAPGDDPVVGASGRDQVPLMGPTVVSNSIFSGLQLSNEVAKAESSDSPYFRRASEDRNIAEHNGKMLVITIIHRIQAG